MGEVEPKENLNVIEEPAVFKNREDQKKKNYRTQRDLSESPERKTFKKSKPRREKNRSSDSDSNEERGKNQFEYHKSNSYKEKYDHNKSKDKNKFRERQRSRSRDRRRSRSREKHRSKSGEKNSSRDEKRSYRSWSKEEEKHDSRYYKNRSQVTSKRSKNRNRSRSKDRQNLKRSRSHSHDEDEKYKFKDSHKQRKSTNNKPYENNGSSNSLKVKEEPSSPQNKPTDDVSSLNPSGILPKNIKNEEKINHKERIAKLFTKRTIGEKFVLAVQMYFERKAQKENRNS